MDAPSSGLARWLLCCKTARPLAEFISQGCACFVSSNAYNVNCHGTFCPKSKGAANRITLKASFAGVESDCKEVIDLCSNKKDPPSDIVSIIADIRCLASNWSGVLERGSGVCLVDGQYLAECGGVGSVYKRTLDVVNVVVKVFNLQLEKAFKSFDVECEVLRNIRHCNFTKIVSSCSNLDFLSLLLEYMPNGSLEKWLYPHNYCLTILEQLNIMINVAFALEYLHHGQRMPIIHCDLKPNNILLDKDMIAHVYDFGIAKLLGEKEFMAQTKTLATIGYMAPGNLPCLLLQSLL
ncbi:hypothetical protein LguiA_004757 [Lonicera macranthoides]